MTREVILCPICGEVIHQQLSEPILSRGRTSSRDYAAAAATLTEMVMAAEAEHERMLRTAEEICAEHMRTRHAWRFKLWQKTGRDWILQRRWPWSKFDHEQFEFGA